MKRLFPMPLYSFCKIAYNNGGFSGKGLLHAFSWFMKTTALEPLRWIELARYNKKVKTYKIEQAPVFILGYYRSGTTYLQQLFMQDDRLGHTSLYQTIFPELMLTFEKNMTPVLEKLARIFKTRNHVHRTQLTWYSAGEEDVAMMSAVKSCAAQWGILFPKKAMQYFTRYTLFEDVTNRELKDWEDTYLYLLKKISIRNDHKPMVLKSPPNTARIKQLISMFPNARFIFIARDPVYVYASCRRLWEMIGKKYMLGKSSNVDTKKIILESYTRTMDRYIKYKELIPQNRLVEIAYEHLINDPVDTMQNIYKLSGLENFEYCKKAMKLYADKQKTYKTLNHQLPTEELQIAQLHLAPYIRYWENVKNNRAVEIS